MIHPFRRIISNKTSYYVVIIYIMLTAYWYCVCYNFVVIQFIISDPCDMYEHEKIKYDAGTINLDEGRPKSSITLTGLPQLQHVRACNTYGHQILYFRALGAYSYCYVCLLKCSGGLNHFTPFVPEQVLMTLPIVFLNIWLFGYSYGTG